MKSSLDINIIKEVHHRLETMQSHSHNQSLEKSLTIEHSQVDEDDEEDEPVTYKNLKISNKFKGGNFKTFSAPLSPALAQQ